MGGESQSHPGFGSGSTSSYPKLAAGPVMKQIHNIARDRLNNFAKNEQYTSDNLVSKLNHAVVSGEPAVKLHVWSAPGTSRPPFHEATKASNTYRPAKVGDAFGPSWTTHWFRVQLKVPEELSQYPHVALEWDASNEGLVWTDDGTPVQGLTGNGERTEWILPKDIRQGKETTIYVEMACNGMFGNSATQDPNQPPDPNKYFGLQRADIVAVNLEARALYFDFWEIGDAAREFPEDSWQEHEAMQVCQNIMDCFYRGGGSDDCLKDCRRIARKYLGDKVDSADVYEDNGQDVLVSAVGYCHIDISWLWPWAETKRKIVRSFMNQCDLLDRYPEHRFIATQPQAFKWLETIYPKAFDRVKAKVKEGTFQPIGGTWVEHDTNLPGGEALCRQFLYGQRYFESRYGQRCTTYWLPDTFGYCVQLPQLSRLAGMSRFFTQKLSWNNINDFPHTTFNWVAPDGSQVLCHMCPTNTYTAEAEWGDVKRSISGHKSMDQDATSLLVFGKGDGGGGPTWQQLEKLRRCRGMADKIGMLPRMKVGDSVEDFFSRLEKKASDGLEFVTWYGELYLELHRGTYTSQANEKRNNRKLENFLHDIEYLATMASIQSAIDSSKTSYKYPKQDLDDIWELMMLCQGHDSLPGSCIEMCYDDTAEAYKKCFTTGERLFNDAVAALGFKPLDMSSKKLVPVAINTLPFARSEIVRNPDSTTESPSFSVIEASATGIAEVSPLNSSNKPGVTIKEKGPNVFVLENSLFSVEISDGAIVSLYDKHVDREIIPPGAKANQLVLYDDKPLYWQAWDVEVYHLRSRTELKPHKTYIVEDGPHRVAVAVETRISDKSSITMTIALTAIPPFVEPKPPSTSSASRPHHGPHTPVPIEISARVDWHEAYRFLKVEFPVDITSQSATYETQYGTVQRPTHFNTTWDTAKFEVCSHRFADLSEATYGVSVLNDSKFGFAVHGNVMRLSLLRAPKAPDGHADMGVHDIRWGILPHAGPLDARTVRAARTFNYPLAPPFPNGYGAGTGHHGHDGKGASALFPYTRIPSYLFGLPQEDVAPLTDLLSAIRLCPVCSDAGIVLDTLKRGEDDEDVRAAGDGMSSSRGLAVRKGKSVVVRLYESVGGKSRGRVLFGKLPVKKVWRCNLLEDDEGEVEIDEDGEGFRFGVRAFEVATYRLQL